MRCRLRHSTLKASLDGAKEQSASLDDITVKDFRLARVHEFARYFGVWPRKLLEVLGSWQPHLWLIGPSTRLSSRQSRGQAAIDQCFGRYLGSRDLYVGLKLGKGYYVRHGLPTLIQTSLRIASIWHAIMQKKISTRAETYAYTYGTSLLEPERLSGSSLFKAVAPSCYEKAS